MSKEITAILQRLLQSKTSNSQEAIRQALEQEGFSVTQSTVSRLLRKIGAIKTINEKGETIYTLSQTVAPAKIIEPLKSLILNIQHNESMIVIHTNPGAAPLIAHIIDVYRPVDFLGTIAGDDTIFIVPITTKTINQTVTKLKKFINN